MTVACQIRFRESLEDWQLTLTPVNAEYDDGALIPDSGKDIDYEVDGIAVATGQDNDSGG